jgi:peptide/nickel transport system permease protein
MALMVAYLIRCAVRGLVVLFLVSVVVFGMSLLAGDPIKLLIPIETSPEQLEQLRTAYGLNDPASVRLGRFLAGLLRGDLGYSIRYQQPAFSVVAERLGATLELALAAIIMTVLVALPAGVVGAIKRDSSIDAAIMAGSVLGHSLPSFFLGLLLIYLLSVKLHLLPTSGRGTLAHVVMPALTLGLFYAGRAARLLRSSMLEVLHQEYMRTARAKGLAEAIVIARHALRNASLPVITILGLELGGLLGGAVVTETIFAWPGIGKLAVEAVIARDFPVVQAVVLLTATTFVVVNLVMDLLYGLLDPRVRLTRT